MNKLICMIFGHRYFVIKKFSAGCRKVGCKRCGNAWGMNDAVQAFVEWDYELEQLHSGAVFGDVQ